jgi:tetratricopeptide (TPR) repeat protein
VRVHPFAPFVTPGNRLYFLQAANLKHSITPTQPRDSMASLTTPEENKGRVDDRSDYYSNWAKKAADLAAETAEQDKIEKEVADTQVGLKGAPVSEKHAKDIKKFKALKEAKKQWNGRKAIEEDLKFSLPSSDGASVEVTESLTGGKPVLIIRGCKNSRYVLPPGLKGVHSPLIKVFIDDCENCSFIVSCPMMVGVDIAHSESCKIQFLAGGVLAIKTVQVDLCKSISLKYSKGALEVGSRVFHAGVESLTVDVEGVGSTTTSYQTLVKPEYISDGTPEIEVQYITQIVDSKLLTEKCIRVGQQPTTQRELDADRQSKPEVDIPEPLSRIKLAEQEKVGGNEAFQDGNYSQAMVYYTKAIDIANAMPDKPDLLHICYSNRAACWLRLGHPDKALDDAKACTALAPNYVKGLFRTGLALHALEKYEAAGPFFIKASKLQPKNKQIVDALKFAELKMRQQYAKRMRGDASS